MRQFAGPEPTTDERLIAASLFRDCVYQFVACFDKSAPLFLSPEEIYGHTNGGTTCFRWLRDMRDGYCAHKFGAQRQCQIGVVASNDGFKSQGFFKSTFIGPNREDYPQLIGFFLLSLNHVQQRLEILRQEVQREIDALNLEEINSLPICRVYGLHSNEQRLSRGDLVKRRERS